MPDTSYFQDLVFLFTVFAFVLGAVVGSFLNVCIYRMPRGLKISQPQRSFCPHCNTTIPWYLNIPLFSWLALRGRCKFCGAPIPFRYFLVELLTAVLFLAVWLAYPKPEALAYMILAGLLVTATFIDFEHFIIPDEITWGGVITGIICSALFPVLMDTDYRVIAVLLSLLGAAVGYFTLWGVVEGGKILFGKKRIAFDEEEQFEWLRDGEEASLKLGDEQLTWSELFSRPNDELVIEATIPATIDGHPAANKSLRFNYDKLASEEPPVLLNETDRITGVATAIIIPREAMGFGDVKFIAAIGAFLGWQAVFFTIFAASIVGAIFGITAILLRHREWSAKIPFGPYLALGALLWLFCGPQLLAWYTGLLIPQETIY